MIGRLKGFRAKGNQSRILSMTEQEFLKVAKTYRWKAKSLAELSNDELIVALGRCIDQQMNAVRRNNVSRLAPTAWRPTVWARIFGA
jgi:hypothetical protein